MERRMKLLDPDKPRPSRTHQRAVTLQVGTAFVMLNATTSMIKFGKISLPFITVTALAIGCAVYGVHSLWSGRGRR